MVGFECGNRWGGEWESDSAEFRMVYLAVAEIAISLIYSQLDVAFARGKEATS
jgi:hypothetical protein